MLTKRRKTTTGWNERKKGQKRIRSRRKRQGTHARAHTHTPIRHNERTTSCVSDWFEFCLRSTAERVGGEREGEKYGNGNNMGALLLYPAALTGVRAVGSTCVRGRGVSKTDGAANRCALAARRRWCRRPHWPSTKSTRERNPASRRYHRGLRRRLCLLRFGRAAVERSSRDGHRHSNRSVRVHDQRHQDQRQPRVVYVAAVGHARRQRAARLFGCTLETRIRSRC